LFAAAIGGDLVLASRVRARWRPGLTCALQTAVVLTYTLGLTVLLPGLWADPYGPLVKNGTFLLALWTLAALERERG
jgi:hypothetical protein